MRRFSMILLGLLVVGTSWNGCGEEGAADREEGAAEGEGQENRPATGPGGMILADGYEHTFTGDSATNTGHIVRNPTPTIVYLIGGRTGNFVHEHATNRGLTPETRQEGDRTFHILRDQGLLYITVTHDEAGEESKDYPANFQGPVTGEEAGEVIDMVMTYNP